MTMTRALIVGPRERMEGVIETLYGLKILHIVDHREGTEGLDIGKPLGRASDASEILVKLRSIAAILQIDEKAAGAEGEAGELREKILALELNISEEDAAKKKTQGLLADLQRRIEEIRPFALLPLSLADYRGYESLEVLVGRVPREIAGLESVTREHEAFLAQDVLAVFVAKASASAMREHLAQRGFAALTVPEGDGSPAPILTELLGEKDRWETRLAEVEQRLVTLRERYAGFLVAARVRLEVEVEKAEAPLRFAVTEHSFVVEGWVPSEKFEAIRADLANVPGIFVDDLEIDEHEADPPILLRNVKPFRPFEMLVKLFSIPNYREIDPTFSVALVFPVFFGLMIGDVGYGIAWFLFGLFLWKKAKDPGAWRDLVTTITWGGFFASLFGIFVFAEAFGIPFHTPPEEVGHAGARGLSWSIVLGFDIPFHARIEKLHDVPAFITLSIVASFLHLGIGYVIGFFNEVRHNVKHAVGKVSWLMILLGLFVVILVRTARWPGLGQEIWEGPMAWFPRGDPLGVLPDSLMVIPTVGFVAENAIPGLAIYLLIVGIVLLIATEGGLHVMEVFGLMANMISYARLAAVGVAKAAMALAFNIIALDTAVLPGLSEGNYVLVAIGLFVAFLFHMIVFLLGAISAYIQAIRLNYVEYFLKFFKGAGTEFRPFGDRTKTEV
ncbi:MAG: hypothetical protein A3K66_04245 [Euryarchaeota archaeon RBG_16_67_27]|nr:MAG: hypothetical protein A3K66_04245 [Euryarchaeota archaeon RBG_16_67_27]